jgi:hypothetical protein
MKVRNGFVSNSSSSSFIVGFPKEVKKFSVADMKEYLFGDEVVFHEFTDSDSAPITTFEVAATIRKDVLSTEPFSKEQIEELSFEETYGDTEKFKEVDLYLLKYDWETSDHPWYTELINLAFRNGKTKGVI